MNDIRSEAAICLVGGGPVGTTDIDLALRFAPVIVAADGGVRHLQERHPQPHAVIGDMDSADPDALSRYGIPVHQIRDQDTTDLEKCLSRISAPLILGAGFIGGRLDHELAAMNAAVKYAARPFVLIGPRDVCFHCPRRTHLDLVQGTRVSMFPMSRVRGVLSEGLKWSVEGLEMQPDCRIGTSNEALGGPVRFGFDRPGTLVILPRRELRQAIEAVTKVFR
jgi:thiamine pyrophosphokinase